MTESKETMTSAEIEEANDPNSLRNLLARWGDEESIGDRIARLEAENEQLRAALNQPVPSVGLSEQMRKLLLSLSNLSDRLPSTIVVGPADKAAAIDLLTRDAQAKAETVVEAWTKEPPTESGEYWHWTGCPNSGPLPMFVSRSGSTGKCFVTRGQLGLTEAIDCDEYGGWWLAMKSPALPESEPCGCESCEY